MAMNEALKTYLETRRTIPANVMSEPGPDRNTIQKMLALATRVPDHGKLAPWRFVVFTGSARARVGASLEEIALQKEPDMPAERRAQEETRMTRAPVVIAVVSTAAQHPKIPEWEQVLSAGAVCLNLFMAANAFGFAANWLTEWMSYDADALEVLGVRPGERIAGMLHIGTPTMPPSERPRPDVDTLTTWVE
ncbi:nitroreductase family protein [Hoeflea sp.]|uniref:nitroreductase family protein n=1 Tax=Hoeflea sp. TaxID=1940281 RepID=UPI003B02622D